MTNQWYTLQVFSGREAKARENILEMATKSSYKESIHEVFIPTEKIVEIRNGEKKSRNKKLYSGYVFINVSLKDNNGVINKELLQDIRSCNLVFSFLGDGPTQVEEQHIKELKALTNKSEEEKLPKSEYNIGDKIKIKQGPFESQQGEIISINEEKGTMKIMVTIFDRQTTIDDIEYWQVEKIQN